MRTLLISVLSIWTLGYVFGPQVGIADELRVFGKAERTAIDERVSQAADAREGKPKQVFYGTLAGWSISRMPLRAEEELELAKAEHKAILKALKTSPAPPLAGKVLKQLTRHLPGVAPSEFQYSLTIIETPDFRAWTAGGGFLYLSRPMYAALTNSKPHAEDRLAFVISQEMGHVVYQHCRVGYQLLKLESLAQREQLKKAELSQLKKTVNDAVKITGGLLKFLYQPNQVYEADLFAADLCRNAGFDVEAGLDILRQGVLAEKQGGELLADPAHALLSNENPAQEKNRPSASERLQQLCFERDGVIAGAIRPLGI